MESLQFVTADIRLRRTGARLLALCFAALLVTALCFFDAPVAKAEEEQTYPEYEFYSNDEYEYCSDGKTVSLYSYHGTAVDVTIPDTIDGMPVTDISGYLFYGDTEARTVRIPEGVTSIGGESFVMITEPLTVYIPASLANIEPYIFSYCTKLELVIDEGNTAFKVENGALLSRDGKILYDLLNCDAKSYVIPEGVDRIEALAFWEHKKLTGITMPGSVTSIGNEAFSGCVSLRKIKLPENLKELGESAFAYCESITSIAVPNGIPSIPAHAFDGCTKLSKVVLPEGLTAIGGQAFNGCKSLTGIVLPESVASIGENAFCNCLALPKLTIPAGTKEIGDRAFLGCERLQLSIAKDNRSYEIRDGVVYRYGTAEILSAIAGMAEGNMILPAGVTEIPSFTFSGCRKLERIVIPEGVTTIGGDAFYECSALTSVQLPQSLTALGRCAFQNCTSLAYIDIPRSIKVLEDLLFDGCTALKYVGLKIGLEDVGSNVFKDNPALETVIIPCTVANIYKRNFVNCNNVTVYTVSDAYREAFASSGVDVRDIAMSVETAVLRIDGKDVPAYGVHMALTDNFSWETFRYKDSKVKFEFFTFSPDIFHVPVQNCIGMQVSIDCGRIHFNKPYDVPFRLEVQTAGGAWKTGDVQTPMLLKEGTTVPLTVVFRKPQTLTGWAYLPEKDPGADYQMFNNSVNAPVFIFRTLADAEAYIASL